MGEETPVRIAQVVCTFPPYHGGMGNMAYSYALGLSRIGHQVEVFCPEFRKVGREIAAPFRIHRLKPWAKIRNSAFTPQLFSRLVGFDIVDLHYPFYGGAEIVYLMKRFKKNRFKLVINYHMDNFGKGITGSYFRLNAAYLTPLILKSADGIIVTSFDYAAHSSVAGVYADIPNKFRAIPPGVDIDRFKPGNKNMLLMDKYSIRNNDKIVLFVGGLDLAHSFKGIDFLIEAWRDLGLAKAKLLIVGQGDRRNAYIRLAAEHGLMNSVLFADPVEDDHLTDYYGLADLLVLPSVNSSEAFGIVLIEAMACGVPTVASDLPGLRSVIRDGKTGFLFATRDSRGLLNAIRRILTNSDLRIQMGIEARRTAENEYSQAGIVNRLERYYQDLLSRPGSEHVRSD
jgi:glycosyltransferase involved in cell wall biosynthesis